MCPEFAAPVGQVQSIDIHVRTGKVCDENTIGIGMPFEYSLAGIYAVNLTRRCSVEGL